MKKLLERLISTMPMTALEGLQIYDCKPLQKCPDLSDWKLLSYCQIWDCTKMFLTRDEIAKLEAMIPWLKIDFCSYQSHQRGAKRWL